MGRRRRPVSDPLALVRDRKLRDLLDNLDDAIDIVDASNINAPHNIEFLYGVINEARHYLRELREARS